MGKALHILPGHRFGRLQVEKEVEATKKCGRSWLRRFLCRCDCGNEKEINLTSMTSGKTTSCGCVYNETRKKAQPVTVGKRYNRWTILKETDIGVDALRRVVCRCDCGTVKTVRLVTLTSNLSKSCGCLQSETARNLQTTHGMSGTRLSTTFKNMNQRCYNPKNKMYKYYGGKGVGICKEWREGGLSVFVEWALTKGGYKDDLEIERKDRRQGYSPDNCTFITQREQANNKQSNIWVSDNGKQITFAQFHEKYGTVPYQTALYRYRVLKWAVMRCMLEPLRNAKPEIKPRPIIKSTQPLRVFPRTPLPKTHARPIIRSTRKA